MHAAGHEARVPPAQGAVDELDGGGEVPGLRGHVDGGLEALEFQHVRGQLVVGFHIAEDGMRVRVPGQGLDEAIHGGVDGQGVLADHRVFDLDAEDGEKRVGQAAVPG